MTTGEDVLRDKLREINEFTAKVNLLILLYKLGINNPVGAVLSKAVYVGHDR